MLTKEERTAKRKEQRRNPEAHAKNMEYQKKWRAANPDKWKEQTKRHYDKHKEEKLEKLRIWRIENPEQARELDKQRHLSNPEAYKEYQKQWYAKHGKEYHNKWRAKNLERVRAIEEKHRASPKRKEYVQQWTKENAGRVNAKTKRYRTKKRGALPKWVTEQQIKEIDALYTEAARLTKLTGVSFHIDHILPLQGKDVSGLHVLDNLQILPYYENLSKGNRLCL